MTVVLVDTTVKILSSKADPTGYILLLYYYVTSLIPLAAQSHTTTAGAFCDLVRNSATVKDTSEQNDLGHFFRPRWLQYSSSKVRCNTMQYQYGTAV